MVSVDEMALRFGFESVVTSQHAQSWMTISRLDTFPLDSNVLFLEGKMCAVERP